MNIDQLKTIYNNKQNIQAVNIITDIQNIQLKTNLSTNKIITYLLNTCTSKSNRKILNILESFFPYSGELSVEEVQKILNKDKKEILPTNIIKNINLNTPATEIKIVKYKRTTKKSK